MKRITDANYKNTRYYLNCGECVKNDCTECHKILEAVDRLAAIEDILGDDYNLDRIRELVQADREGQVMVERKSVYRIGETRGVIEVPYKPWMNKFMGVKFFRTMEEAKADLKAREQE